ncbi:hypothetical protein CH63R_11095 [Colletotrichum higginsianum IMI 349063]|uniref:Uncharacterized protein n=1 Tax=Colletotrichum higginsianum (strain IMI 349063) TaxID=759273 RepID=A0A1B7XXA6_COLHI|nr:hypothetical protein CH63R_11095 [Colletotrichum higginsianum IMI 349063]OBR04392.1 hypothetical protein CH63R_11095 [Colletotrichum higginsianum IMI 349063]
MENRPALAARIAAMRQRIESLIRLGAAGPRPTAARGRTLETARRRHPVRHETQNAKSQDSPPGPETSVPPVSTLGQGGDAELPPQVFMGLLLGSER